MIIGNNNSNSFNNGNYSSSFEKRFNTVQKEGTKNQNKVNPFQVDQKAKFFHDTSNKVGMADKTFALLQERLNRGEISLEEFNRQCQKLNKFRQS